ncbi:malate synthase G [Aurantiacibacter poecillastricola]|uniref:malate synthase G n=1 Tax=Aurantiacibacter poecillastricola TaxID=3064385 RepID=UPI00273FE5E1|nr:malate synthase G [Aurantiacibacter sp. 219JJ12-13]MDP5263145.1 malate synthase G [Aurantiacibacter sp. 219JJ12-13]
MTTSTLRNTSDSAEIIPRDGYVHRAGLSVDTVLAEFIEAEALPGTDIEADRFWTGLSALARDFTPQNRALLKRREELQAAIDDWHRTHRDAGTGVPVRILRELGYLVDEPDPFTIGTNGVDPEIAQVAGPQLVVPALNARFVLNAINARWGSLYDAFYGTDALGTLPQGEAYDEERGALVIAYAKAFLDEAVPLAQGSWSDWTGGTPDLADAEQMVGTIGDNLLLRHNGLHIEIFIDPAHEIGANDPANIADIRLESALSTIIDLEDSVAAVDAEDKVAAYRNWLGAMRGDLVASFTKGDRKVVRTANPDRTYRDTHGDTHALRCRSLLLVRNVGHLMTTPAIRLPSDEDMFEGLLDAAVTVLIGMHDLKGLGRLRNSREGSIYVVKPKMHGPEECVFADDVFAAVEDMLGLARNTVKVGVMDEERRTSANLAACIHALKDRVFFINTGFLDRTGDEIHTSMLAGPMQRKGDIKRAEWIAAYEDRNVQIGLACGFAGRAQIGKGMWAAPDAMHAMLSEKIGHPMSGASTAWVPSPTAATLHATHYHRCEVAARQQERADERVVPVEKLLTVPLAENTNWSAEEIASELDNNVQGILGYVVRWIDAGIGCSKVPDIHDIGLMEDRATLRISSQHISNWLHHGIVDEAMVDEALRRMAAKVDEQNRGDPAYRPMAGNHQSIAFTAARDLILRGKEQPSGYTEPLLRRARTLAKQTG